MIWVPDNTCDSSYLFPYTKLDIHNVNVGKNPDLKCTCTVRVEIAVAAAATATTKAMVTTKVGPLWLRCKNKASPLRHCEQISLS